MALLATSCRFWNKSSCAQESSPEVPSSCVIYLSSSCVGNFIFSLRCTGTAVYSLLQSCMQPACSCSRKPQGSCFEEATYCSTRLKMLACFGLRVCQSSRAFSCWGASLSGEGICPGLRRLLRPTEKCGCGLAVPYCVRRGNPREALCGMPRARCSRPPPPSPAVALISSLLASWEDLYL